MAKGILEFNLPEEEKEFSRTVNSAKAYCVLYDVSMWLRNQLKYQDLSPDARKALEEAYAQFNELVGDLLEDM